MILHFPNYIFHLGNQLRQLCSMHWEDKGHVFKTLFDMSLNAQRSRDHEAAMDTKICDVVRACLARASSLLFGKNFK